MITELLRRPYAHRGLHDAAGGVPENSLPAVGAAVVAGFGVEIDVQVSRDGQALVHHDITLGRMCDVSATLADLDADVASRLVLKASGATLPRLEDVLEAVSGTVPVLLDLKPSRWQRRGRSRLVQAVSRAVRRYPGPLCAVSFDPVALRLLARSAPTLPRGQGAAGLLAGPPGSPLTVALGAMGPQFAAGVSLPQLLSVDVDRFPVGELRRWRMTGWPVLGWTVRTVATLHRLADQVDNVIVEGPAAAHLTSATPCPVCRATGRPSTLWAAGATGVQTLPRLTG